VPLQTRPATARPLGNRRAWADTRHERIALDLQLRDGDRENSTGDDPTLFDPTTGPEELRLYRGPVEFHEVE